MIIPIPRSDKVFTVIDTFPEAVMVTAVIPSLKQMISTLAFHPSSEHLLLLERLKAGSQKFFIREGPDKHILLLMFPDRFSATFLKLYESLSDI